MHAIVFDRDGKRAIVLADGGRPSRAGLDDAWPGWADAIDIVVAADGGAGLAPALGLRLDAWVGDGDSLDASGRAALREAAIEPHPVATDKDESDTELGVLEAVRRGATDVTVLGALGGSRLDHALANVTLLAHPALQGRACRLLDPAARVTLLASTQGRGEVTLTGRVGDLLTLLPLGGAVTGVTASGLRYGLEDDRLEAGRSRGLSNVRLNATVRLAIDSGWLLVIETPATLTP